MTKGTTPRMLKGMLPAILLRAACARALVRAAGGGHDPRGARGDASAVAAPAQTKVVRGEWASVTHDPALADDIKAETLAADLLEQASDKPDGIYPAHVAFTLVGLRPPPSPLSVNPVLRVCPVDEYKSAYAVSPRYVRDTERTVRALRALLRRQPARSRAQSPRCPSPTRAKPSTRTSVTSGSAAGAASPTSRKSQQDEGLINNQSVTYEFRGLTDDGRYYVTASLPVAAPFLPADRDATSADGYTLPQSFYGKDSARLRRAYNAYVNRVRLRLERLAPDRFQPSLRLYDAFLGSLDINN